MINNSITFISLDTPQESIKVAYIQNSRDAKPVSKDAEISRRSLRMR